MAVRPNPAGSGPTTDLVALLRRVSLSSLPLVFDRQSGLIAKSRSWDGTDWRQSSPSRFASANACVGLNVARVPGGVPPLDPDAILDHLAGCQLHAMGLDEIAWSLWADAVGPGRHLEVLWRAILTRLSINATDSMRLGWVLVAMCHYLRRLQDGGEVRSVVDEVVRQLLARQNSSTGLFFPSGGRGGWLRRRPAVAGLPAQSYAAYALATHGAICGDRASLRRAADCADCLVALQGARGQWWRQYDVRRGRVVESYPVYSANQDVAMPLLLGTLDLVSPRSAYRHAAALGLAWELGLNEVGRSLVDEGQAIIYRGVRQANEGYEVIEEMHSYHPGRCLWALHTVPELYLAPLGAVS